YELADREWATIRPMLPNKARGVPRVDDRRILNVLPLSPSAAPYHIVAGNAASPQNAPDDPLLNSISCREHSRWDRMSFDQLRRREFITLLGGAAAAWPFAARAQQGERMRRVGVLMAVAETDPEAQRHIKAFRQGLQDLGWAHDRDVQIEYRWGGANPDRIRTYAAELVALKSDVILAQTALVAAPLQRETRTVPIVFVQIVDPVESGFVASLARPGGNLTGFTPWEFSTAAKWLELLKEIAPGVARVAAIINPVQSPQVGQLHTIERAASSVGVLLTGVGVSDPAEIE